MDYPSLEKEYNLHRVLQDACRNEEENIRHKSRCLWLKAVDQNSTFFHKQVEGRENIKAGKEIQIQGNSVQEF